MIFVRKHVRIVANNGHREKPPKGLERLLEELSFDCSSLEDKLIVFV